MGCRVNKRSLERAIQVGQAATFVLGMTALADVADVAWAQQQRPAAQSAPAAAGTTPSAQEICARNYEPLISAYEKDLAACNAKFDAKPVPTDDEVAGLRARLKEKEQALRDAEAATAQQREELT